MAAPIPDSLLPTAGLAPPGHAGPAAGASEHTVQFYDADEALIDAVVDYAGAALDAGDAAIIIATEAHRHGIEEGLRVTGRDAGLARDSGRYYALDAHETLARFMVGNTPDRARFGATIEPLIAQAATNGRQVRAFGEMVALLALQGDHAAAIRLEELWNELQARRVFSLFCAYPMISLAGPGLGDALGSVCAQHAQVIPSESYTALRSEEDRSRAIVAWQQKAQALEAALAAERAARRQAEAALRQRDEFLSIASHELRTPIATLSGHAQLLLRRYRQTGDLDPERTTRSLETIHVQSGKLARLVDQLLDVNRLEAGKLAIERTQTDLAALVEQAGAAVRTWGTPHTIVVTAPPRLPARVDPLRIEQVLANLLHNAVKYGLDGGQIEISLTAVDADTAELAVRDHGPGIAPEQREHLFERYFQASPNGGSEGGMGLGLYISRQIVEQHGGDIRAEFPPEGGTRMVVRLPIG